MIPQTVLDAQRWCVSKNKIPLDVYALERGYEWGASDKRSHSSYVDHKRAVEIGKEKNLPVTLYVEPSQCIYVIDVEKTCPAEIRRQILLSLHDHIVYLERSLSGKGYHLMVSLDAPVELRTAKYKKWFEILAGHHCTFTDRQVTFDEAYGDAFSENEAMPPDDERDAELLEKLSRPIDPVSFYEAVNGGQPDIRTYESATLDCYKKAVSNFDGRHADLFGMLCDMIYIKTVDQDFNGDYSAYEFGYASKMHYHLQRIRKDMIDADMNHYEIPLSAEEAVMLVFMALKQVLPSRKKHSEFRNGLPWLLFTSQQVYLKTFGGSGGDTDKDGA